MAQNIETLKFIVQSKPRPCPFVVLGGGIAERPEFYDAADELGISDALRLGDGQEGIQGHDLLNPRS